MASSSSSSYRIRASTSADISVQWKYDVFLSFRGEDTRKKFTDHLYDNLESRGIKTFRDDPNLERGTAISPELLAAIGQSRYAVVVLSPNYASSTWCLLELVKIVTCMGDRGTILPVFYEVDPSDVRHQRGSFGEAFAKHEKEFRNQIKKEKKKGKSGEEDTRKLQEWRDALTKVANLAGWTSKDYRYETELIKEIVEKLWKKVHPTFTLSETESLGKLVGIDSKLMEIEYLLETAANDDCFMGIWGMGGIGKTTLARLIYQRISNDFEVDIFLNDVRQVSATHGIVHVQKQLLCQIMKEKDVEVRDVYDGMAKTKRCLSNRKVLLVIDDVDQFDQLEKLAGQREWFGSGSLVIITTRDQHLLHLHGIEKQYKGKGLNEQDALQLFCWKAFQKDEPEEGYMELSKSILDYSGGLPIALKILGSFLYKRDRGDWESAVAKLKKAPIDQVLFKALRISYDGLDKMTQQVFLDIAGFLKGNEKEQVIQMLNSFFGFDTRIMISVLVEKSLLTISGSCVDMHDLLQEMGKEIVRQESEQEPRQYSHLWLRDDIFLVLKENRGTEAIRSISLCLPGLEELAWNPNAFSKMSKLKFLKIQNLFLRQGPEYLPDAIRVLEWGYYPSKSLPPNFHPVELTEIILRFSKIDQLWHGIKYLGKLKLMDLSYSLNLTATPDFTGMPHLEKLVFEGCAYLVDIHPSIISLRRLKVLNFKNCRRIQSFPGELEMHSLVLIELSGCAKVDIFPQFAIGKQEFEVSCSSVSPHRLSLLLVSLKHFCCLKELHLNDCNLGEGDIPDDIGGLTSLESLDLSVNNFISLPASIGRLSKMKRLNLVDCKRLQELPCLPSFSGTCDVTADNCISLKRFPIPPELCSLWKLSFSLINCCSLLDGEGIEDDGVDKVPGHILYPMQQQFLQQPPPIFESFSIVIPGSDIPGWFRNQSVGALVRQKLCRSYWSNCNYIGFAFCVLFGPEEDLSALGYAPAHKIFCPSLDISFPLNQIVKSDHLGVFFLPRKNFHKGINNFSVGATAGLKVKKWGVRTLFKEEVGELHEYKRSIYGRKWIRMVREPPPFYEMFCRVIPRNDIPAWFETRGKTLQESVYQKIPPFSCCIGGNTWMGFALCVLFSASKSQDKVQPDDLGEGLKIGANKILCWWESYSCSCCWGFYSCPPSVSYSCALPDQVVNTSESDHLCVFFFPAHEFQHLDERGGFKFKTKSVDAYLELKGYGVRSLYEHDLPNTRLVRSLSLRNWPNEIFAEQLIWLINNCGSSRNNPSDDEGSEDD